MRRVTAYVLIAVSGVVAIAVAASASASGRAASSKPCSTTGLHYKSRTGSAVESDKVEKLKTIGVPCSSARTVAGTVAQDLLHGRKASAKGWRIHVKKPCAGCSPVWKVTANGGSAVVTFEVHGGTY